MYVERENRRGETTSQERREGQQAGHRILGHVVRCDGARAVLAAFAADDQSDDPAERWTVGRMISINLGSTRTVGLVYGVGKPGHDWRPGELNPIEVEVELIGEVRDDAFPAGKPIFDRGITCYPHVGAHAHRIRSRDLEAVYDLGGRRSITIGQLSQDEDIAANIAIEDLLSRHFAIVGTTGVGKSTAVSLLMRKAIAACPDLRILILDPHNEFAASLPEHAIRIDSSTLDLPFWMFRLEEFAEVLFRGREVIPEEVDLLRDLIPVAKAIYRHGNSTVRRAAADNTLTADTPVPYRIADLLKQIDDRIGLLDGKTERPVLKSLRVRIEQAATDPGYRFMFSSKLIEDTIHQTIGNIFRVPHEGRPVTCFEMAGLPSEVVNAVCSVLARLAFDLALWSEGRLKLLVMCEEAHRYMPANSRQGFAPTREALARIAKEGRKYGCFLGIVTQRPGELDPTILSQCSTVFAMRLANEQDKAIIRSAISDSSASSLSFLSSMGQREAIAFGEGVATTMRLKFERQARSLLPTQPRSDSLSADKAGQEVDLVTVVNRLRNGDAQPTLPPETSLLFSQEEEITARPGDQEYHRPASLLRRPIPEEPETRHGLKPSAFGARAPNR